MEARFVDFVGLGIENGANNHASLIYVPGGRFRDMIALKQQGSLQFTSMVQHLQWKVMHCTSLSLRTAATVDLF